MEWGRGVWGVYSIRSSSQEGEREKRYVQQEWSRVKVRRVKKRPKGDKEREKRQKRWGRGGERKGREGGGFRMFQAC